jgi:hypothetical protein
VLEQVCGQLGDDRLPAQRLTLLTQAQQPVLGVDIFQPQG